MLIPTSSLEEPPRRRRGALVLAAVAVALLLALAGGAGYVALSPQPVQLGAYTLAGPRSTMLAGHLNMASVGGGPIVGNVVFTRPNSLLSTGGPTLHLTTASGADLQITLLPGRRLWHGAGFTLYGP